MAGSPSIFGLKPSNNDQVIEDIEDLKVYVERVVREVQQLQVRLDTVEAKLTKLENANG